MLRDKKDDPNKRIWLCPAHENCRKCKLNLRLKPQRPYGTLNTNIMFIGESPGKEIDQDHNYAWACGSGFYFKKFLEMFGFNRDEVYMTNLVKCFNPGTTEEQIDNCRDFLELELILIEPKVIVCTSLIAFNNLPNIPQVKHAKVMRIWHPSYAQRPGNEEKWKEQWKEVRRVYDNRMAM